MSSSVKTFFLDAAVGAATASTAASNRATAEAIAKQDAVAEAAVVAASKKNVFTNELMKHF